MGIEELLASVGLGGFVAEDFFVVQVGLLAAMVLLFIFCLVLSVISFRAAGSARNARMDAESHLQSAQDLALEVRHLTAQVENAATRQSAAASRPELRLDGGAAPDAGIRVGAREDTPEAEIDFDRNERAHPERPGEGDLHLDDTDEGSFSDLEAAKEAASVPSSLLGGFMRRRN